MPKVTIVRKGNAKAFLSRIEAALKGPMTVKVGFPVGKAEPDLVMRAIWNEFGTETIPERPFFRNAMADGRDGYRRLMKADAKKMLRGEMKPRQTLDRLGLKAQGDIQRSIASSTPPPNAPVTIARKGSSTTLIDTGEMRQRVTFIVEE